MKGHARIVGVLVAAVVASAMGGCAADLGRVVPLDPADMAKMVGTWDGTMIFPSGVSWPATLVVYPSGTYLIEAGAFTSRGKAQLKNGRLDFVTSYTSGGLAIDNRTGSATLLDQGSAWGLVGSGWADTGLYNFDFSKSK